MSDGFIADRLRDAEHGITGTGRDWVALLLSDSEQGEAARDEIAQDIAADDLAAERLKKALVSLGAKAADVAPILRSIRATIDRAAKDAKRGAAARDAWKRAEHDIEWTRVAGFELKTPEKWRIDASGIYQNKLVLGEWVWVRAMTCPVIVSRRMVDVRSHRESWRLRWLDGVMWREVDAGREVCASARAVVELAAFGLPVTSTSASACVEWLDLLVATNRDAIPASHVSRQMGHLGDNGCLVGSQWHPAEGSELPRVEPASADVANLGRMVAAMTPCGTRETFDAALVAASAYPSVMVGAYASLASPLLDAARIPGIVVHWGGTSTTGKTTALRLAAAVWGCPDESQPASYVRSWGATMLALEQHAAVCGSLPVCLDETQRWAGGAHQPLSQAVYMLAQGQGRSRGAPGQRLLEQSTWRAVVLSTGEGSLARSAPDGGLRVRVLDLHGSPWGGHAPDAVGIVGSSVLRSWGHDGPRWVREVVLEPRRRAQLIRYAAGRAEVYAEAHAEVGARLGAFAGLLEAVAKGAEEWLGWPAPDEEALRRTLSAAIARAAADLSPSSRAYDDVCAWLAGCGAQLLGGDGCDVSRPPAQGWLGAVRSELRAWDLVPARVSDWLRAHGYGPDACFEAWADAGLLASSSDGRRLVKSRLGGQQARCLRLAMPAVQDSGA